MFPFSIKNEWKNTRCYYEEFKLHVCLVDPLFRIILRLRQVIKALPGTHSVTLKTVDDGHDHTPGVTLIVPICRGFFLAFGKFSIKEMKRNSLYGLIDNIFQL